jgi:hypothetical protein
VGDRWGEAATRYNILRVLWDQGKLAQAYAEIKIVVELAQLEAALTANK